MIPLDLASYSWEYTLFILSNEEYVTTGGLVNEHYIKFYGWLLVEKESSISWLLGGDLMLFI